MCLICAEFQRLTNVEARRNLAEMSAGLGDHAAEVEKKIAERELVERMKGLLEKWEKSGLLDGLRGRSREDMARIVGPAHAGHLLRETE